MSDTPAKSIMDKYMDAEQKRFEGVALSSEDKKTIALVRARDVAVASATLVLSVVFLPVALVYKGYSSLKAQWQTAQDSGPRTPPSAPPQNGPQL